MVEKRHRQIAEETAKPGRSGGGDNTGQATANQAIRVARAVYNFALDKDETLPPNPVRMKKIWFEVAPRARFVTGDQLPDFYRAWTR